MIIKSLSDSWSSEWSAGGSHLLIPDQKFRPSFFLLHNFLLASLAARPAEMNFTLRSFSSSVFRSSGRHLAPNRCNSCFMSYGVSIKNFLPATLSFGYDCSGCRPLWNSSWLTCMESFIINTLSVSVFNVFWIKIT